VQQLESEVQLNPFALQTGRAPHTLLGSQYPEQQSPSKLQPVPFEVQGFAQAGCASVVLQYPEQQSVFAAQLTVFDLQLGGAWQVFGEPAQAPANEAQQSASREQPSPVDLHGVAQLVPLQ
jgi:hypothetical protein